MFQIGNISVPDCGPPGEVEHANYTFDNTTITTYQSIVNYTCHPGYYTNESVSITCDAAGKWTIKPNCTIYGESKGKQWRSRVA